MTISTNAAGIACCGNCGSTLAVVCTGNCPEPHIVFREDYVASLPVPKGRKQIGKRYPTGRKAIPGICSYRDCMVPIAPQDREGKRGRSHTKCERHLQMSRKWSANVAARKVAS